MKIDYASLRKITVQSLGQVVLIFIGVTVAFWFDGLKKEREDREFESSILTSLRVDLEGMLLKWDELIANDNKLYQEMSIFLELTNNSRKIDSLSHLYYKEVHDNRPSIRPRSIVVFGTGANYFPVYTSYESIKNRGFELILDSTLRRHVAILFSDSFEGWLKSLNDSEISFKERWYNFELKWIAKDPIAKSDSVKYNLNFKYSIMHPELLIHDEAAMNFIRQRYVDFYISRQSIRVIYDRTLAVINELKEKGY